jgi:hypothetical protein
MRRCPPAGALLAALLVLASAAHAGAAPSDGTWKVVILQGQEQALLIVRVENPATGPQIELVTGLFLFQTAKLQPEQATDAGVRFKATAQGVIFDFVAYPPKGDKQTQKMLGSVVIRGNRFPIRLERTTDQVLDQKTAMKMADGIQDYIKTTKLTDPKEKATALQELVAKHPESPVAYFSELDLTGVLPASGASEGDVKGAAEKVLSMAAAYGPEMRLFTVGQVAKKLTASKKAPALAVAYAQQAEQALPATAPVVEQAAVLKTLLSALKQADKKDEARGISERLAKIDKALDAEYLKDAVPFTTTPFTRSGATGRVALVELFTGAQCPPCVAADVAFDAALKTYQPQDVILLQYHLHIPGPDALTNADTESRSKFYSVRGVPSTYVGGGDDLGLGGGKAQGKPSFDRLTDALKGQLDKASAAKIRLTAQRSGEDIAITAEVSDLKDAGKDLKLRLALVEEMVRYPGGNGQRFHHHVVRAMPGGVEGITIKDSQAKQQVTVNLAELKRTLTSYLEEANKRRPFLDDERPMDLDHLMVVAFLQNDTTKEVLQAAQVEVRPGTK